VRVVGNNPNSVPVTIGGGTFLDSPVIRIYADNCTVVVEESRLYGDGGGLDFSTTSTGKIIAKHNRYYQGAYTFAPGSRVIYEDAVSVSDDRIAILPSSTVAPTIVANDAHRNNSASPNLNTTSITRQHAQLNASNSESAIDVYSSAITSGTQPRIAGIRCSTLGGVNAVHPLYDNLTSAGMPYARFSVVYSAAGVQTTSDERQKDDIQYLTDTEIAVAKELKTMINTFKYKGSGKKSIGVVAQRVCEVFDRNGLDWRDYNIVTHDEWDGGDIYSVNYNELLAFIISAI
jgi:hypothetical protein